MEETKVTTGDVGFQSFNVMQSIGGMGGGGGGIEYLAMEEGENKDIVAKLIYAVEQLTKNNAALTAQLSDSMKINLEMDRKLNIKAAQGKDPKGKILEYKAKRKSAF